jgi:hypothetical protein
MANIAQLTIDDCSLVANSGLRRFNRQWSAVMCELTRILLTFEARSQESGQEYGRARRTKRDS